MIESGGGSRAAEAAGRPRRRRASASLVGALAAAVAALAGAGPAAAEFQPPRSFAVGEAPSGIVIGDLNADGNPDAVVANRDSDNLTVLLGDGAGGLMGIATAGTGPGTQPVAVQLADFNGDNRPDAAVALQGTDQVAIMHGDGSGVLGPAEAFPLVVGALPSAIAIGDYNYDQRPDVAVADQGTGEVSVLLNNTVGGLGLEDRFAGPAIRRQSGRGIVTADFNSDTKPDLAVASAGGNVAHLLGVRIGAFEMAVPILAIPGSLTSGIAVGDFNGDGKPDLVAANQGSNTVPLMLGDGAGGFAVTANPTIGGGPTALALGDFNRDGKQDLAVASLFSNSVTAMLGDGAGGLGSPETLVVGTSPDAIAIADMNKDGFPDILVANNGDNSVSLLLGKVPTTGPPPPPPADLTVTQSDSPDPVALGGNVSYTITVTNISANAAAGVTLIDTLPGASSLVSASSGQGTCTAAPPGLRCDLGFLPANGGRTIVTVVVRPTAAGQITNAVAVSAAGSADTNPADNAASLVTTVAPAPPPPFAATLTLGTSAALGRRTQLVGIVRCNRACRVTGTVAAAVRPNRTRIPRIRVRVSPANGSRVIVRLDLRAARPAILAALRAGRRVTLNVDLRARDAAGASKRIRRAVRLRP